MASRSDETDFERACADSPTWVGTHPDDASPVTLTDDDLQQTCYIQGNVPDQQTALCHRLCVQWAHAGRGFCYIHPRNGPPLDLLYALPADRLDDVVWVDLSRNTLSDYLDVPDAMRVCFNPLDGPASDIDAAGLVREPTAGRIADLMDVFSESRHFGWNAATVWSALLPGVFDAYDGTPSARDGPLWCLSMVNLHADVEPLLSLVPARDRPTIRTQLQRAFDHDPRVFRTARSLLGDPTDGLQYYNPLSRETTYSVGEGIEDDAIILVSGDFPGADEVSGGADIARSATHLLTVTIVRRLWEALQSVSGPAVSRDDREDQNLGVNDPYPLVLDGLATLLPGEHTLVRELLSNRSRASLALVASGPSTGELSDEVARDVRAHVGTTITFEANATDDVQRSLSALGMAPFERAFAAEENEIADVPSCWVETNRGGSLVGFDRTNSVVPAVPFGPVSRHRSDSEIEQTLTRSLTEHGTDLSWSEE